MSVFGLFVDFHVVRFGCFSRSVHMSKSDYCTYIPLRLVVIVPVVFMHKLSSIIKSS